MGLFSSKPTWEKSSKRAAKYEKSGDLVAAWRAYTDAAERCPDDVADRMTSRRDDCARRLYEAHMEMAENYRATGGVERAIERYELAAQFALMPEERQQAIEGAREIEAQRMAEEVELDEPEVEQLEVEAHADQVFLMVIGSMDEEVADAYEALDEDFRAAFVAAQGGQIDEALAYFETAAARSENAILHYEHGSCLRAKERNAEAIAAYSRAEELEPSRVDIKLALAEAAWSEKDWALAEEVLQRAVDLTDENAEVYEAIATTAFLTESPEYGLEACEVGLELEPMHRRLMLLKGQLYHQADQIDEALAAFETVIERYWKIQDDRLIFDAEAGIAASQIYLERDIKLERAEELLRACMSVTRTEQHWPFEILLAQVLGKLKRDDEASDVLRQVARQIPANQTAARIRVAELMGNETLAAELKAAE
jgi:tetratricopeptide (TPR) repeat protein